MGHAFEQATFKGSLTEDQVRKEFRSLGQYQLNDCDHDSWGGGWYDFDRLAFTGKVFDTEQQATDYLESLHDDSYWKGTCHAARCKDFEIPKSALNHWKQHSKLQGRIFVEDRKERAAIAKAKRNNRTTEPAYVEKARAARRVVVARIQPQMDARRAKIDAIMAATAAKCKKSIWVIGGWHREG